MEVKRISPEEFVEFGFLQEVNRQFLHPLGLALEVQVDDQTNEVKIGGIWDYRDDPEGMRFDEVDAEKAGRVMKLQREKEKSRRRTLGYVIQPIPGKDGERIENVAEWKRQNVNTLDLTRSDE